MLHCGRDRQGLQQSDCAHEGCSWVYLSVDVNYEESKGLLASCFVDRQQPDLKVNSWDLAVLHLSPQELDCVPQSLFFYVFFGS